MRTIGKEIGARYLMEGSLRQAGVTASGRSATRGRRHRRSSLGGNLQPALEPDQIFAIQDELIPRIVSTCTDAFGVLARSISDAVRGKERAQLSPYEALMRGFGYHHRLTPGEHAEARDALERAVEQAPRECRLLGDAVMDLFAWVRPRFQPPARFPRSRACCRRTTCRGSCTVQSPRASGPGIVLFFRKDVAGCLHAAQRAIALNPLDGSDAAISLITFAGDWDRGCALIERAMELNPHHPGWYRLMFQFFNGFPESKLPRRPG